MLFIIDVDHQLYGGSKRLDEINISESARIAKEIYEENAAQNAANQLDGSQTFDFIEEWTADVIEAHHSNKRKVEEDRKKNFLEGYDFIVNLLNKYRLFTKLTQFEVYIQNQGIKKFDRIVYALGQNLLVNFYEDACEELIDHFKSVDLITYDLQENYLLYKHVKRFKSQYPELNIFDDEILREKIKNNELKPWIEEAAKAFVAKAQLWFAYELYSILEHACYSDQYSLDIAAMFVDSYNKQVTNNHNDRPTKSMFNALQIAESAFRNSAMTGDPEETIFWVHNDVTQKIKNILFFYCDRALLNNLSSDKLHQTARLMSTKFPLIEKIQQVHSYGLYQNNLDLFYLLQNQGFSLIKYHMPHQHHLVQHIWVNQDGIQIRIKPNRQEITIGLTYKNPLVWSENGEVVALRRDQSGNLILDDRYNEVFKIVSFMAVPATLKNNLQDWHISVPTVEVQNTMDQAHLRLSPSDCDFNVSAVDIAYEIH